MKTKFKKIRTEAGLSQAEMAKVMGVSKSCISAWESGARIPGSDKILSCIKLFNLNADYFADDLPSSNASRCFDMTALNSKGAKKMYDLYLSLIEDEEYLKKS